MTSTVSRVVTGVMILVTVALAALASQGPLAMAGACGVAVLVLALAILGLERFGILALAGAFGTAPMYRGIGGIANVATPTDLLLLLGLLLLLPEMVNRKNRLPAAYVISLGVLAGIGLFASTTNASPVTSAVYVLQWLLCLGVLPAVLAMWQPGRRIVDGLVSCYLAGQMVSLAVALAQGPAADGRYQGLSHHPNDFGLAGCVCLVLVWYLLPHRRSIRARLVLVVVMFASLGSIVISGSRGVTLAAAVVVVLVPVVERSGTWAFIGMASGALGLALLPYVVQIGGEGGSLERLSGDAGAAFSDSVRESALSDGWHRFLHAPFFGSGLDEVVGTYHNLFLEVAVAVGVFGFAAYLVICYLLARPLFTSHPMRRLSYLTWVFLVTGVTFPGIVDRTVVVPLALAVLAAGSAIPADAAGARAPEHSGVR